MKFSRKTKRSIIVLALLLVGGVGWFSFFSGGDDVTYDFIIVEYGDLIQEVSVTGRVKPTESVQLGFEKTGRVSRTYVAIGDRVFVGQTLVVQENNDIQAKLAQAEAQVKTQEAKLAELIRGTRTEEIEVQVVKVQNAKTSLEETKQNLVDNLHDSYTKSDDAVRNKIDQFFSDPRSADPKIDFATGDAQLEAEVEFKRTLVESLLTSWRASLDVLTQEHDLDLYTTDAQTNLDQVKSFLDNVALLVNDLDASGNLSQTTVDGYKADVATARTNINTATSNLSGAEKKLRDAHSSLALAEQELVLKKAGATVEQLSAQEAKVEETEASVKQYQAELSKTILYSPLNGVVTKQDAKVGEIVTVNTAVVFLISVSQFEIEANVPEADIAKLHVGDGAQITLDAYGSSVIFEANIAAIDPAETVIEGVPTYKTTLQFSGKDERIKSGMTANIDILTGERHNVLAIPGRAVFAKEGNQIVRVIIDGETQEREVTTGLRGSNGTVEIVSGLSRGDKVITFVQE